MGFKINYHKLFDIMQAFYSVAKIKIILFDENHNTICFYPQDDCAFCRKMKKNPYTAKKCAENDLNAFNECKKTGKLLLYTCYAGLVEGCAPLKQNDTVIGYIMFGQISDLPDRETLNQNIDAVCKEYHLDKKEFLDAAKSIKLKKYEIIMASAKIFEACISYIILNEMFVLEPDKIIKESEKYIENNLDKVTVKDLYTHLNISRTALYDIFKRKTKIGVAEFIRKKQFEKAKELLKETNLSIKDISEICGFTDYNYFSRVYKKKYGISPKAARKTMSL